MDEIDKRILSVLLVDGRASLTEISKKLQNLGISISEPTIKRRIHRLIDSGIIRRFSIDLDYHKLGLSNSAFIYLKINPYKVSNIARSLSYLPEVKKIYIVQDEYNLVVEVQCANYKEINRLVESFSSLECVTDIKVCVIFDSYPKLNLTSFLINEANVLVEDADRDGENEVIFDNPLLSIEIKPHQSAKISRCILKATGNNQIKTEEGIFDSFAEEGWGKLVSFPVTSWKILEFNNKLAKVKFSILFNGSKLRSILLEKIITLLSDSNILSIDYRITNKSNERQEVTLWVSSYLSVGGDVDEKDYFFIPVEGKMESDAYRHQISHVMWPVMGAETLGKDAYYHVTMEQPNIRDQKVTDCWAAWIDTRSEEFISFFYKKEEVSYIKRCYLLNSYSLEIIYNTHMLNPQEYMDHRLFLIVGKGYHDLIRRNLEKIRSNLQ